MAFVLLINCKLCILFSTYVIGAYVICMLVVALPHEDGGVPPKHVAVNKMCIVIYIIRAYVSFSERYILTEVQKFVSIMNKVKDDTKYMTSD